MALYTTHDHRGRPVELDTVVADHPLVIRVDPISSDAARRIEVRLGRLIAPNSTTDSAAFIVLGALFAAGAVLGARWGLSLPLGVAVPGGVAASMGVTIVGAAILRKRFGRVRADAITAVFLAERRCPACGYDLNGVPLDHDALTVCPECGAAWNVRNEP